MTSNTFNETHLAEFIKRRPPAAVGKLAEQWRGAKPGSWFAAVDHSLPLLKTLNLDEKLTRHEVENVIRNAHLSEVDASMVIFAWGGMTVKNGKLIFSAKSHWSKIVSGLRSEKFTYLEAYDQFLRLSLQGLMPGCGPAYYTKLIFFLTKHLDRRGFIMDQWLGRSVNLLAGREIVRLDRPRREVPIKKRYVHKENSCSAYAEFCEAICNLSQISGETNPDMRIREENVEMRLFSEGRGKGEWRNYVIANDISG
jgi:hypothetical protein